MAPAPTSEPEHTSAIQHIVVSVLGEDRSGIVAAVSGALAQAGANIIDIRQTILSGIFSMTMIVEIDENTTKFDELQTTLEGVGNELGVQVHVQREDVFRFMHRIEPGTGY